MSRHSYATPVNLDTVVIFTPTESMHTIELLCGGSFIHEMKAAPQEPGRHRYDDMYAVDSPNAVFLVDDSVHGPSFECPREWHDGMAVGFEYLSA